MRDPVRIGNCSGFYGDRIAAAREMVEGGAGEESIDVLCGDYLAELTMLILAKAQAKDPAGGYARTFLTQMEQVLGTCSDRGIKIVANAGGLNPAGLAVKLRELADRLGITVRIAHVEGDDLRGNLAAITPAVGEVKPVSANAYLGGWGIAEALGAGADVVVTGRVTDASLVVGPAAWWHGWERTDWDRLAARHVDTVLVAPCGVGLDDALAQAGPVRARLPHVDLVAIDSGSYVVRAGPRLVDGVEALAWSLHPDAVAEPPPGRIARDALTPAAGPPGPGRPAGPRD